MDPASSSRPAPHGWTLLKTKQNKIQTEKQSHNCAEMVSLRTHCHRPQVDSQHCLSNTIVSWSFLSSDQLFYSFFLHTVLALLKLSWLSHTTVSWENRSLGTAVWCPVYLFFFSPFVPSAFGVGSKKLFYDSRTWRLLLYFIWGGL